MEQYPQSYCRIEGNEFGGFDSFSFSQKLITWKVPHRPRESTCWLFLRFVFVLSCHVGIKTIKPNMILMEGNGHYWQIFVNVWALSSVLWASAKMKKLNVCVWSEMASRIVLWPPSTQLFNLGEHLTCKIGKNVGKSLKQNAITVEFEWN